MSDLEKLRAAFPPNTVGKLPRNLTKNDQDRGQCREGMKNRNGQLISADGKFCGGHHARSIHLDYVGHAAVTDRLLSVDPTWSWEPFALTNEGLPALDHFGNLWIRLTVCGVTRIGVGDGKDMKEIVGDALRNAAMRFGVALDLWSKDELESGHVAEVGYQKSEEHAEPDPPSELTQLRWRVWNHAKGDTDEQKKKWVAAAIEARGLSTRSLDDMRALAEELEQS